MPLIGCYSARIVTNDIAFSLCQLLRNGAWNVKWTLHSASPMSPRTSHRWSLPACPHRSTRETGQEGLFEGAHQPPPLALPFHHSESELRCGGAMLRRGPGQKLGFPSGHPNRRVLVQSRYAVKHTVRPPPTRSRGGSATPPRRAPALPQYYLSTTGCARVLVGSASVALRDVVTLVPMKMLVDRTRHRQTCCTQQVHMPGCCNEMGLPPGCPFLLIVHASGPVSTSRVPFKPAIVPPTTLWSCFMCERGASFMRNIGAMVHA